MLTLEDIILYETGSSNLVMSFIYSRFTNYFMWVCERKFKRYKLFVAKMKMYNLKHSHLTGHYIDIDSLK